VLSQANFVYVDANEGAAVITSPLGHLRDPKPIEGRLRLGGSPETINGKAATSGFAVEATR
jgi:hypothetical protein